MTWYIHTMLSKCWAIVYNADPALNQHRVYISCLRSMEFELRNDCCQSISLIGHYNIRLITKRRRIFIYSKIQIASSMPGWNERKNGFIPINPWSAEIFLYQPWRPKCFFYFVIKINVSASSLWFNSIPMLCVYGNHKYFHSTSDVRIWRLRTSDSDV